MVDKLGMRHYRDDLADSSGDNTEGYANLSFAAFVLKHVGCGDELIELRIGERLLLEWCPACAVVETFGSPDG